MLAKTKASGFGEVDNDITVEFLFGLDFGVLEEEGVVGGGYVAQTLY